MEIPLFKSQPLGIYWESLELMNVQILILCSIDIEYYLMNKRIWINLIGE